MRIALLLALMACESRVEPPPAPRPPALAPVAPVACKSPTTPQFVALPARAVAIAARGAFACAVLETGRAWCWGSNEFGQAGLGPLAAETAPHDSGLDDVAEIALGETSGCARHPDGTTQCWGRKTSWNPTLPQSRAAQIPEGRAVEHVAAGHDHACAIVGHAVECFGVLGHFAGFPPAQPRIPGTTGASALATGDDVDCAVVGGAVACWGLPFEHSCSPQCERDRRRPVAHRVPRIRDAVGVTVGSFDACALRRSGGVACWGSTNGATDSLAEPVAIAGLIDARQVSSGMYHACAVRATGEVACWGNGGSGARGDGRTDRIGPTPSTVVGIDRAVAVATGTAMSCALLRDGRVACWGLNDHRQLGFATDTRSATPVDTCALDRVIRLAASGSTTCALRRDGTVACWGTGLDHAGHTAVPTPRPDALDIVDLVGSQEGICALDRAGAVRCWRSWPTPIAVPPAPVTRIALGRFGLCGVHRDGTVSCGGVAVPDLTGATRIAVGDDFACALAAGTLRCWGPGTTYPPGRSCSGDVCDAIPSGPPPRHTLAGIVEIATNRGVSICARTADDRARCNRPASALTEATEIATEDPWASIAPAPLRDVRQVVHGRDHACALRDNGRVACWGDNTTGQLGTGTMGLVAAPAH